jgi:hypothetical protein
MVISDRLTYGDLVDTLEAASADLRRPVRATIYTLGQLRRRIAERSPFVTKVLDDPRVWIVGGEGDLPARPL